MLGDDSHREYLAFTVQFVRTDDRIGMPAPGRPVIEQGLQLANRRAMSDDDHMSICAYQGCDVSVIEPLHPLPDFDFLTLRPGRPPLVAAALARHKPDEGVIRLNLRHGRPRMVTPRFGIEDFAQFGNEGKPESLRPGQWGSRFDGAPERTAEDDRYWDSGKCGGNQVGLLVPQGAQAVVWRSVLLEIAKQLGVANDVEGTGRRDRGPAR